MECLNILLLSQISGNIFKSLHIFIVNNTDLINILTSCLISGRLGNQSRILIYSWPLCFPWRRNHRWYSLYGIAFLRIQAQIVVTILILVIIIVSSKDTTKQSIFISESWWLSFGDCWWLEFFLFFLRRHFILILNFWIIIQTNN